MLKKIFKFTLTILVTLILIFLAWWILQTPSNNRDWTVDQAVLPYAEIENNIARIHNIRNFTYRSTTDYTPNYYDETYNIDNLETVWFIVEPFSGYRGAAHTFLSFGFKDGKYLSISVEIRKEKGESFSAVKGLLNQYELMYVIADERDVIKLRSNYRKDQVFVYPVNTTKERSKTLFLSMLKRANKLKEEPEFYNTLTNTCTTNIVTHVNEIVPNRIPIRSEILFPAESDRLAYSLGLLNTTLSFDEARKFYNINERALTYANDPNFSEKIRRNN